MLVCTLTFFSIIPIRQYNHSIHVESRSYNYNLLSMIQPAVPDLYSFILLILFTFSSLLYITMKLSDYIIAINKAFEVLISSIENFEHEPNILRNNYGVHVHRDLPQARDPNVVPQLLTIHQTLFSHSAVYNKEKLL